MLSRLLRTTASPTIPFEPLEGRSMLAADFSLTLGTLAPGFDKSHQPIIKVPVEVRNVGNMNLQGGGRIEYYFSTDRTLSDNDFLFTTTDLPRMGGAGSVGKTTLNTTLTGAIAPRVGRAVPEGQYFIIAKFVPANASLEANTSNNVAATTTKADVSYTFGNVGGTKGVPLTVTLADGDTVTFTLNGAGFGHVLNVDNQIVVVINGTDNSSFLRMTPAKKNQTPTINSLTVNGNLKGLNAPGVNVDGNVTINGGIGTLVLGDISHSTFRVLGQSTGINATFGNVLDSSMTFAVPLQGIAVSSWRNTDSTPDRLNAPVIDSLSSRGNFGAGVVTSGEKKGFSVRRVDIAGDLTTGGWNIASNIETFNVRNITSQWGATIHGVVSYFYVGGNLSGTVGVGSVRRLIVKGDMLNANFLAGADLGADGLLGGTGANADRFNGGRIGTVEIRGRMELSVVAAGLTSTNATLLDADDRLITSNGVQIDLIIVVHTAVNSRFLAHSLPATVSVNHKPVRASTVPSLFTNTLP